jgi:hypothetical protein
MTDNEYLRGAERTYCLAPDGIPVQCFGREARHLAALAQSTQVTLLHLPGDQSGEIPDEVMRIYEAISELRGLKHARLPDAEARQDLLECGIERHEHQCLMRLHRKILFGTYQWQRPLEACLPFGDDGPSQPSWLAIVVVPPKVRRCTVVFDPLTR